MQQVQTTYRTLLLLYHKCLENLRPGVPVRDVVDKAHRYLREKAPDLEDRLTKVDFKFACFHHSGFLFCLVSSFGNGWIFSSSLCFLSVVVLVVVRVK